MTRSPFPTAPLRILILGANGFIGSSLTRAILAQKDWEVFGMDVGSHKLADSLGLEVIGKGSTAFTEFVGRAHPGL